MLPRSGTVKGGVSRYSDVKNQVNLMSSLERGQVSEKQEEMRERSIAAMGIIQISYLTASYYIIEEMSLSFKTCMDKIELFKVKYMNKWKKRIA